MPDVTVKNHDCVVQANVKYAKCTPVNKVMHATKNAPLLLHNRLSVLHNITSIPKNIEGSDNSSAQACVDFLDRHNVLTLKATNSTLGGKLLLSFLQPL